VAPPKSRKPCSLTSLILARLEEIAGQKAFDTREGVWKSKCPADPRHDVLLISYSYDPVSVDLLCTARPRCTESEMVAALGFVDATPDPSRVLGCIGDVSILRDVRRAAKPSKAESNSRVAVSLSIAPDLADTLRHEAAERGSSFSDYATALIELGREFAIEPRRVDTLLTALREASAQEIGK
jgi:hypothetical protein